MYKIQQLFNYVTLILAVITVVICMYSIIEKRKMYIAFSLMILTIVFNGISRIYNKRSMNLTKRDKEMLNDLKNNIKSRKK